MKDMGKDEKFTELLKRQIERARRETRTLEFKSNYQDPIKLGRYISALSNGACLDFQDYGYLFFGVDDTTLDVKGTTFDMASIKAKGNQALELYLRQYVDPKIPFTVDEFLYEGRTRVVVFTVPAAVGEPTCFMGVPWIRVDSHVTELKPYVEWMRQIYNSATDWSAEIVRDASIDDLSGDAIAKAREKYCDKHPHLRAQVEEWTDMQFLSNAKVLRNGRVTNAAIILLGKETSEVLISPAVSKLRWVLRNHEGMERDYAIFSCPMILAVDKAYDKIRNLKYRFIDPAQNTLFPKEMDTYEPYVIREAMHNAIAHQDYSKGGMVNVVEYDDKLVFSNLGRFIPGNVRDVLLREAPQERYQNKFLASAMVELGMVDTIGSGIKRMYGYQRDRRFPMPKFDLDDERVELVIYGKVTDKEYFNMLCQHPELSLVELDELTDRGSVIHIESPDEVDVRQNVRQNVRQRLNERQARIVALLTDDRSMSAAHLAEILMVNQKTVYRDLKVLGLHWEGPAKTGQWAEDHQMSVKNK